MCIRETVSRVRISPSPRIKKEPTKLALFLFAPRFRFVPRSHIFSHQATTSTEYLSSISNCRIELSLRWPFDYFCSVHEKQALSELDINRIIEMAWEDRTPFEAIHVQFGLPEAEVIRLMRSELKRSSFNLWRKRVNSGVSMKHARMRPEGIDRFKCTQQRTISMNKISKR